MKETVIEKILEQPEFKEYDFYEMLSSNDVRTNVQVVYNPTQESDLKEYEASVEEGMFVLKIMDLKEGYRMLKRCGWKEAYESFVETIVQKSVLNKRIPSSSASYAHIVPEWKHTMVCVDNKDYFCFIMPYYPCCARFHQGRYKEEVYTIDFAIQIGEGLKVLHDNHLVHRKLKLQSIREYVQDFEYTYKLSCLENILEVDENTHSVCTEVILFSGYYTDPKCVMGEYSIYNDIYSLGMCIARFRFGGKEDDFVHMINGTLEDEIIWPNYYSQELIQIIKKCIACDLECRYQSVDDILQDLKQIKVKNSND